MSRCSSRVGSREMLGAWHSACLHCNRGCSARRLSLERITLMERRAIVVTGVVQGVGFRPFVHRLAGRCQLHGSVKNHSGSVLIEVEGEPSSLDVFLDRAVRPTAPLGPDRAAVMGAAADPWGESVPDRAERDRRREPGLHFAGRGDMSGLPCGNARPRRPSVRLSVPELHQLRTSADDHQGRAL